MKEIKQLCIVYTRHYTNTLIRETILKLYSVQTGVKITVKYEDINQSTSNYMIETCDYLTNLIGCDMFD